MANWLTRWSGWIIFFGVVAAAIFFENGVDGLWNAGKGFIYAGFAFLVVESVIVRPIQNEIRELDRKIDGLHRRLDRLS